MRIEHQLDQNGDDNLNVRSWESCIGFFKAFYDYCMVAERNREIIDGTISVEKSSLENVFLKVKLNKSLKM